jgi:hypothetical protein
MTTATTTTKCPEWCKMPASHIGPDDNGGHSGPSWPNAPSMHNSGMSYYEVSISTGSTEEHVMAVYLEANGLEMTSEQAIQAGRNLIEAGQWALAHRITA